MEALARCKKELGVRTILGVSNISFGLPCRPYLNTTFLTMAMYAGLDLAIMNPSSEEMMAAVYSYNVLTNRDKQSMAYIARYADKVPASAALKQARIVNGKIKGNLYELDYPQHFRHVKEQALPADNYTLLYEHGERVQPAGQYLDCNPDPQLGKFERFEAQPNDPEALHFLMREEKRSYDRLKPGDFKAHITALHDSRIEAEAQRIVAEMKRQDSPNSPNKTHFMVELSPYFMQLASTKDTDRLFAMLPYKTLSFSKIEGRHGTFAFLDKSEDRSRNIRKTRPSVRAQLTADKKTAAPKKAAAKRKNHDLEV